MRSIPHITLLFALLLPTETYSSEMEKSTTIAPGARYEAGWLHRLFFGDHWRDLWTDSVEVPILDCEHFAGGLTPTQRGGGFQTKSLRFKGKDGREYKFRSLDKDPSKTLPQDLQKTIAADVLQDQISSSNPFAPMIVAPLLRAVDVLNSEPTLVFLPDGAGLGEYREEFGDVLGTIEENPAEGPDGEPGFAGAEKVISTYKLFKRLEEDPDERMDAREYLKARMMDIFLGDWDRHRDQWRWAGFRTETGWIWKPIPRDRDQAFARLDGFFPWLGTVYVPQLEGFDDDMPDIEELTWSGRFIDRRLLVSLDKPTWDSLVTFLTGRLSDSLIESAVHHLPVDRYATEGHWLQTVLKARRAQLQSAADEFYEICANSPDIRGTEKSDVAEVQRIDDRRLRVALYRRDKHSGEKTGEPRYERIFDDNDTREVRLYLLDGDDKTMVSGTGDGGIRVIVIGGDGEDELIDNSHLPVEFHDSGKKTTLTQGGRTSFNRDKVEEPTDDMSKYEPVVRDYGHNWMFFPNVAFNPDDGLAVGGKEILHDFTFRTSPFNYRMELSGGIASKRGKLWGEYSMESYSLIKGARVSFLARASQLERLNFFGFGNESSLSRTLLKQGYYKVSQQHIVCSSSMEYFLKESWTFTLGASLKFVKNDRRQASLEDSERPYGSGDHFLSVSVGGGVRLDTRDNRLASHRGYLLEIDGSFIPKALDNENSYGRVHMDVRTYLTSDFLNKTTFALRAAGEKIFGTQPFFESAFIGGVNTIRAFEKERFAGDASLYFNTEARIPIGTCSIVIPGRYGVSLFGDVGRVFSRGESSVRWHSAYGVGPWVSFLENAFVVSMSIAHSVEKTGVYITGGFTY